MPFIERAALDPVSIEHPGFYRVPAGLRLEVEDQLLDEHGRMHPIALDQVGREVTPEMVVLRVERRQRG